MRKTLVLSAIALGLIAASAGITNYSGPTDQPHIMGVQDGGDAFSVEVVNVTPTSGVNDSIENVRVSGSNGTSMVSFEGRMEVPTPCHTVNHSLDGENSSYTLNVESVAGNESCVQSISELTYSAEGQLEENFTLTVEHDGEVIDTITSNDTGNNTDGNNTAPPGETRPNNGFFQGILQWFANLF